MDKKEYRKARWAKMDPAKMSGDEYDRMLATQREACAICFVPFDELPSPHHGPIVDHDHTTGKVRGLLCKGCNIRLAAIDDAEWLRRAREYVAGISPVQRLIDVIKRDLTVPVYEWDGTPVANTGRK